VIVVLRLAGLVTLAEVIAVSDIDTLDLRAYSIYADGRIEVLTIANARRGEGDGQWSELPTMAIAAPPAGVPGPDPEPASDPVPPIPPPWMPAMVRMRG
jgi:hypothetical protein